MRTIHLVSHTHWDREWYLPFQQFRLKLVALVDNLLDLLEQDADYRAFMLDGQAIVLEDYLQIRPEQAEPLKKLIDAGRVLVGPWYILPDEFLVSPEAHIRNLLEGERVLARFGKKMMIGYLPDTFGHIGQMPQILRGFGIDSAAVWRGMKDEPCEFLWQAPDGSQVLGINLRDSYSNAAGVLNGSGYEGFVESIRQERDSLAPFARVEQLLLMQGTDHMEPNPETSAAVQYATGKLDGDMLVHSTLPEFVRAVRARLRSEDLPVVNGELRDARRQQLLPGVLSTRMWIKQRNQACETLLEKWAEPFSVWANLAETETGAPAAKRLRAPEAALRAAWRLLIQCHPHDSICGCSVDEVHEEMRPRFEQAMQIGEVITGQSLDTLARAIDTHPRVGSEGAVSAVAVFNPTAGPRADLVRLKLDLLPENGAFDIVDELGNIQPCQSAGMGSSLVLNVSLDRKAFREGFRAIADGVLNGMRIQKMTVQRYGSSASIEALVSQTAEANMAAWERARGEVEALLADSTVTMYTARAYSVEAALVEFVAPAVPGYGWRTFWVKAKPPAPAEVMHLRAAERVLLSIAAAAAKTEAGRRLSARLQTKKADKAPSSIMNEHFCVTVAADGTLDVEDRGTGRVYHGLNRFLDGGDRGDTYNYSPPAVDRLRGARLKHVQVKGGPAEQVLELSLEMVVPEALAEDRQRRSARLTTLHINSQVKLIAGSARIEIQTEVENRARDHRLRVHFPAGVRAESAEFDGHFEVVQRQIGTPPFDTDWAEQPRSEKPQRAYTLVTDKQAGLLIANRGLPEVEVLTGQDGNAEIALTLLRCVGWLSREDFPERRGHAGPGEETPLAQMPGKWSFDYAIIPFVAGKLAGAGQLVVAPAAAADSAAAVAEAAEFETPMRAVNTTIQAGSATQPLRDSGSFLQVTPAEYTLSAVKMTEDGQGWLVRGYNRSAAAIQVTLEPLWEYQAAYRANLAEMVSGDYLETTGRAVRFTARPHEIVTIIFRPERA